MKITKNCLVIVLIIVVETVSLLEDKNMFVKPSSAFNSFSQEYQKTYTSANELKFIEKVFNKNIDVVGSLNENPNNTYPQGITYYSDLTPDEFKHLVLNKRLAFTPQVLVDITKWNDTISQVQEKSKQESLIITSQKQIKKKQKQLKKQEQKAKSNKDNKQEKLKKEKDLLEENNKKKEEIKEKVQKKKQQEIKELKDQKKEQGKKQIKIDTIEPQPTKESKVEPSPEPTATTNISQSTDIPTSPKQQTQINMLNITQNTQQTQIKSIQEIVKWIPPQGALPSIDWRIQGKVSHVKMQGSCGNCYSFSTTGALEGAMMIKHNKSKISYSDQQITDCCGAKGYGCNGCEGGWQWQALRYVLDYGIVDQEEYKLQSSESGQVGQCKKIFSPYKILNQKTPFSAIKSGNVSMLYQMVSKQPVSVGVDSQNMQFVLSGDTTALFTNCSSNPQDANHAMLIVGYDADGNWILKNSWSSYWGDNGYIKLKAGNTCGVANFALHPNVI